MTAPFPTGLHGDGTMFSARRYETKRADDAPGPGLGWEQNADTGGPTRPLLKTLTQFIAEYTPLDYAIEPIVRTGSLYSLTAKTGAGKTAWMISTSLATATGRGDIMKLDIGAGRVAYLCFENPDDIRMRFMIAAFVLNVDVRTVSDRIMIIDARAKPEAVEAELRTASAAEPFRLIFVDTLAAFFDGNDINDAVQGGEFIRRMRPMTRLPGLPAVVVAAHPVKNASEEQLVPYGSGAILNEVDGNLTLWRRPDSGTVKLHWLGKLRGLEFEPVEFRFEISGSPDVLDAKGRQVQLPTMLPANITEADQDAKEAAEIDISIALLRAVQDNPKASQAEFSRIIDRSKSIVNRKLQRLEHDRLVDCILGKYALTDKGRRALDR